MALKTFTATRAVTAGDSKRLSSWHLSAGGVALVVRFCDAAAGTPLFEVQVPINASASEVYGQAALIAPSGWHIELVSGTLNRGCIDLV